MEDGKYWYYFQTGRPMVEIPHYLNPQDVVPSGRFTATYPDKVRKKVRRDLGITDDQFDWKIYNMDPLVTRHAVLLEIPFNKSINRVPVKGGEAERYNQVNREWESNSDGVYTPERRSKKGRWLAKQ